MVILSTDKIDAHRQLPANTCIPSAVEYIIKQTGGTLEREYELQDVWAGSSFEDFDGKTICGLTFKAEFTQNRYSRGPSFPLDRLFNKISEELAAGHYVAISLAAIRGWHIWVIYADEHGEFQAVSKKNCVDTNNCFDVKRIVVAMNGTDILTYSSS